MKDNHTYTAILGSEEVNIFDEEIDALIYIEDMRRDNEGDQDWVVRRSDGRLRSYVSDFAPIPLTENGECLDEYPLDSYNVLRGCRPESGRELSGCVGVHWICCSFMDIRNVSIYYAALTCRGCGLRVLISRNIKTIGDLRTWSKKRNFPKPPRRYFRKWQS